MLVVTISIAHCADKWTTIIHTYTGHNCEHSTAANGRSVTLKSFLSCLKTSEVSVPRNINRLNTAVFVYMNERNGNDLQHQTL